MKGKRRARRVAAEALVRQKFVRMKSVPMKILLGFVATLCAATIILFVLKFRALDISNDPNDWSIFSQYIGGIVGPLFALANIVVLYRLTFVINSLEEKRSHDFARPYAQLYIGNYEDDLYVKILNLGLGPQRFTKFVCKSNRFPNQESKDIKSFMPDIGDILWEDFTINGPRDVVPKNDEVVLIELKGDICDPRFIAARTAVREYLKDVLVDFEYEDMFGNRIGRVYNYLSTFA